MEILKLCSTYLLLMIFTAVNPETINPRWEIHDSKKRVDMISNESGTDEGLSSSRYIRLREPTRRVDVNIDGDDTKKSNEPHSRKKRLIWITDDGRLALPPGTVLSITPTLSLPLVRYPPDGFLSNITMSFPLTIDFDKLGLTDNENPLGVIPPVFARSMGRAAGSMLATYIGDYLRRRDKRSTDDVQHEYVKVEKKPAASLPDQHKFAFHGGERAILYGAVEDLIATFGMNGKACILRAICESHSRSLAHLGIFGEIIKLFFTASKSDYAELLTEYVEAERTGQGTHGPGECYPYYKECPRSMFKSQSHKYSESAETVHYEHNDEEDSENVIELDAIEKEILQKTSKQLNDRHFNM